MINKILDFCTNKFKNKEMKQRLRIIEIITYYGYGDEYKECILLMGLPVEIVKQQTENAKIITAVEILNKRQLYSKKCFLELIMTNKLAKAVEFVIRLSELRMASERNTSEDLMLLVNDTEENYLNKLSTFESMNKSMLVSLTRIKEILDEKNVETEYEAKIHSLCKKFNFKYTYINNILFITSSFDEWRLEFRKEKHDEIKLYHKNKKYSTKDYHLQRKFEGNLATVDNALEMINKHDKFLINNRYNYDDFNKLLKKATSKVS